MDTECHVCAVGRYQSHAQSREYECQICPAGQYQDSSQSSDCEACPPGYYLSGSEAEDHDSFNDCNLCGNRTYSPFSGAGGCLACVQQPNAAPQPYISCSKCDHVLCCNPGTSLNESKGTCENCSPGMYQDEQHTIACKVCEQGYYADTEALVACKECKPGRFGRLLGAMLAPKTAPEAH